MDKSQFDNRVWGALAVKGLLAILFGVIALTWPGRTVTGIVYVFGAFAFLDGISAIAASVNVAQLGGRWGGLLLAGIVGIVIGVLAFVHPAATALAMVYYLAVWAVLSGVFEIAAAIRLRKVVEGEWMLVAAAVLSILFGLLIASRPGAGLLSLVWVIGIYAIIFGCLELGLAFRLRGAERRMVTA
jgi:uncharacterized membrane protein HdeD (DUF308 family)